jgi:hypothetical protein
MATHTIQNNELGLGRAILLATDTVGMSCEGAFWLFDPAEEKWLYFLVTSFVEYMGPRKVYLALNDALERKLSPKEMEDFEILIIRPGDKLVRELRKHIKTDRVTTEPRSIEIPWNDGSTTAIVYRMAPALNEPKAKSAQKRFRRLSNQLAFA